MVCQCASTSFVSFKDGVDVVVYDVFVDDDDV